MSRYFVQEVYGKGFSGVNPKASKTNTTGYVQLNQSKSVTSLTAVFIDKIYKTKVD